ncbi:uncharacterized protein TNIN_500031 [Trichonephila inaurata madagascariensis]|uniref:Thyroglobulin type-1 domain-containing protein n=1 Tax=Trichonephila inaurata madagascariensis TaxID=2747483 RepID=A0A8X6XUL1_9ARAC|nr:uncharacterized protein TNIN_500031 [Trichonephila inaurata madagascariensis]
MLRTLILLVIALGIVSEIVKAETRCEQHRTLGKNSKGREKLVPNCDENGDYMPMQCYQGSKLCSCYGESGHPITPPSTKLKSCKCLVQRYKALKSGLIGVFVPQCETDGTFSKRQCIGSVGVCFCVNPMTGNLKSEARREVNC